MFKKVVGFLKRQSNLRYMAFGFLALILIGSGLLMIPAIVKPGQTVTYIDALYTSTSAICVTGLLTIDIFDHFNIAGQIIVMFLIQIGGLGITTLGAGFILAIRRRVNLKERNLIQESLNMVDAKGLLSLFRRVFIYTAIIEGIGVGVTLISFISYYPFGEALWKSVFHSVAAFNNSGMDIFGGMHNLQPFKDDILLNINTCVLIILGGLGFLVMTDILQNKFNFKKMTLQTKIVITMTVILLIGGMVLIKFTEKDNITWLGAFFTSTSSRTAGFSTFDLGKFSKAGLLIVIILMFIGASPGSTGGGIKTTTLFVLFKGMENVITDKSPSAFKYALSKETIKKAFVVFLLALSIVVTSTFIMCMIEANNKDIGFLDILFEMTSAFSTTGLSTGITTKLLLGSKILSIIVMYIGRVGPLTVVSLWYTHREEYFQYSEGIVPIG